MCTCPRKGAKEPKTPADDSCVTPPPSGLAAAPRSWLGAFPASPRASTLLHFTPPATGDAQYSPDRRAITAGHSGGAEWRESRRRDRRRGVSECRSGRQIRTRSDESPGPARRLGRSAARVVERSGGPMGDELLPRRPLRSDPDPPKEASCCRPSRPRASSRTSSTPPTGCARPSRASSPVGPSSSGSPSPSCSPRVTCSSRTCPGVGKTTLAKALARPSTARSAGSSSRPTCCPSRPHGRQHLPVADARVRVPARARVREHRHRRRDQPRLAQDAVGAARVHAGGAGDRRRPHLPAAATVPRRRHAEPGRDGGHLPAARGAAGPVHGPPHRRLPEHRVRARHARPAGDVRPARHPAARDRRGAGQGRSSRPARRLYAAPGVKRYVVDLVDGDPRGPGPAPRRVAPRGDPAAARRQGARRDGRPRPRAARRRPAARRARPRAPAAAQHRVAPVRAQRRPTSSPTSSTGSRSRPRRPPRALVAPSADAPASDPPRVALGIAGVVALQLGVALGAVDLVRIGTLALLLVVGAAVAVGRARPRPGQAPAQRAAARGRPTRCTPARRRRSRS